MTAGRRGVALTPMETRRDVIVRAAVLADQLGYETFAVPEGWGLDSIPVLTEIALRTTRIQVASGVLSVWGRTPATLAMSAATLHQVSGGRFVLGLGASTRALAEGFHDVPFERPAEKLRDTVTSVRALLDGRPAQLSQAQAARPLRLAQPPAPEVPIWVAALGERSTRVAAQLGDGWIPAFMTRDRLPAWTTRLSRMRATAAPDAQPLTVAAGPIAAAADNADAARDIVAACVAWYLGAMGDVYRRSVSDQGYAAQVSAVLAANARPSPRHGTVPPDAETLLDQLAAYGTGDQLRQQLTLWDQAADIVTILLPPGLPWPVLQSTLLAAAPGLAEPETASARLPAPAAPAASAAAASAAPAAPATPPASAPAAPVTPAAPASAPAAR